MVKQDIIGSFPSRFLLHFLILVFSVKITPKIGANGAVNWNPGLVEQVNKWVSVQNTQLTCNIPRSIVGSGMRKASTVAKYVRWAGSLLESKQKLEARYLLLGTENDVFPSFSSTWVYQSSGNSWILLSIGIQPPARESYTVTTLCNMKIILFGGKDLRRGMLIMNDTWLFDGTSETWEMLDVPVEGKQYVKPRSAHTSLAFSQPLSNCSCKESLLVYGGALSAKTPFVADLQQQMWEMRCIADENRQEKFYWIQKMNGMQVEKNNGHIFPPYLFDHCAAVLSDSMYVWGGLSADGYFNTDGIWEYNLISGLWKQHRNTEINRNIPDRCLYYSCTTIHYQLVSTDVGGLLLANSVCSYIFRLKGSLSFEAVTIRNFDDLYAHYPYSLNIKILDTYVNIVGGIPQVKRLAKENYFQWFAVPMSQNQPYITYFKKREIFGCQQYTESNLNSNWRDMTVFRAPVVHDKDPVTLWKFDLLRRVWFQICSPFAPYKDWSVAPVYLAVRNNSLLLRYSPYERFATEVLKEHINRTHTANFIWIFHTQIRMWTLCLETAGQKKLPRPRQYSTLTEIGNGSILMFGGLTNEGNVVNELWRVDVCYQNEYLPVREDCVVWTLIYGNNVDTGHPRARYRHASFVYNRSLFVFGGVGKKGNSSNFRYGRVASTISLFRHLDVRSRDPISDMWQFRMDGSTWKKIEPKGFVPVSACPIGWILARRKTKVVLVAGEYTETDGSERNCTRNSSTPTFLLDMTSLSCLELADAPPGMPYDIRFIDENVILSTWKDSNLNSYRWPHTDSKTERLELAFSLLRPACPAGHSCQNWDEESCSKCPRGSFSPVGSPVCYECPEGLTTNGSEQRSLSDCVCSNDYCLNGRCSIADAEMGGKTMSAVCQCRVGYTGRTCRYPTYYLIGTVSFVGLIVLIVSLSVFVRKMLKHRKARRNVEDELTSVLRVWNIPPHEVILQERIDGETPGSYGEVYRAVYRDLTVAVKHLNEIMLTDATVKKEFERELEVMRGLRHRNIIMFFGAGHVERQENGETVLRPFLVIELMSRGTLKKILDSEEVSLCDRDKVSFALDAARGLRYLHSLSPPRIHRDIKSANLLVSHSWVVKVSDFGSARLVRREGTRQPTSVARQREEASDGTPLLQSDLMLTRGMGSLLWRAPEIFATENYGTSADVYSYGIVLWEILCREDPYRDHSFGWIDDVSRAVQGGTRPSLPPSAPSCYVQLMKDCWQANPDARPTSTQIVDRLTDMADVLNDSRREETNLISF
jgi:hypothetical protein